MAKDGGDVEEMLKRFGQVGINADALAVQLQNEGVSSFAKAWHELMQRIVDKKSAPQEARHELFASRQ